MIAGAQMLPTRDTHRAYAITARFQVDIDSSRIASGQQLLRHDVRHSLRPTDAKDFSRNFANRRVGTKSKFNRLFEVHAEVDVAAGTMHLWINFSQRSHRAAAATEWTHEVPLQIQNACARGAQTSFQNLPARLVP